MSSTRRTAQRRRRGTAVLALTSLAWGQACTSYQLPRSGPILPGSNARVQFAAPASVASAAPSPALPTLSYRVPGGTVCQASVVEGVVGADMGDTLAFEQLMRVRGAGRGENACAAHRQVAFVARSTDAQIRVQRISWGRTTLLVLGVTAVVAGVLAAAVSDMEYDMSSSGSSWSF